MDGIASFDLKGLDPLNRGFSGAASDGRWVYYAPLNNGDFHGRVMRYDPRQAFDAPSAWSHFDAAQLDPGCRGFVDLIFDGRFLYLVPFCRGEHHGIVVRYDTQGEFERSTSWAIFDTQAVHPRSRGFVSGCFDGRYLSLAPYQLDHSTHHGQVTRYDTQQRFDDVRAWEVFDLADLHPDARGYHSALATQEHVYFIPYLRGQRQYSGRVARLDRSESFVNASAWQCLDVSELHPGAQGYIGAAQHQGMIYFAPYADAQGRHGRVLRLDTRADWTDSQAWQVFDCARIHPGSRGFFGAVCEGHYLYLIPHCRGVGQYHGQITRYDLRGAFDDPASWTYCDLAQAHPDARGFIGAVPLSGHLYLAPFETDAGRHSGVALRLNLRHDALWHHAEASGEANQEFHLL
jgi:hypothetical protein